VPREGFLNTNISSSVVNQPNVKSLLNPGIIVFRFQESKTKENTVTLSREMIGVTLIASITTLYFGLNTELTVDLAKIAADSLLPGILR